MTKYVLIVIAFAVLFFIPWNMLENPSYGYELLEDYFHFVIFFGWSLLLTGYWQLKRMGLLAAAISVVAVEVLQPFTGRTFSWVDLWLGWCGCLAAYCWLQRIKRPVWKIRLLVVLAGALLPAAGWGLGCLKAEKHFPEMVQCGLPALMKFQKVQEAELLNDGRLDLLSPASCALKISVNTNATYPGVTFYPAVSDWAAWKSIVCEVSLSAAAPQSLWIRVDDEESGDQFGSRLQVEYTLQPGATNLVLPITPGVVTESGRRFRWDRVQAMTVFLYRPSNTMTVEWSSVRLDM